MAADFRHVTHHVIIFAVSRPAIKLEVDLQRDFSSTTTATTTASVAWPHRFLVVLHQGTCGLIALNNLTPISHG